MKRLIECVPNFSEGRDPAKVDAIVAAMSSVPGVYVLDREMDADHNRCVITLAGDPDAVGEAAILGTGKAMELIDMTVHKGAHPRVGDREAEPPRQVPNGSKITYITDAWGTRIEIIERAPIGAAVN